MEKQCLSCAAIIKGRADKKFCDDNCRNSYNNLQNSDANNYVRNINNTLRKNRRILTELNLDGKTRVHKSKLLEKGFHFGYLTNISITKAGAQYTFCYDQGYLALDNDYFLLVVRNP
jgi:hypothetical protein